MNDTRLQCLAKYDLGTDIKREHYGLLTGFVYQIVWIWRKLKLELHSLSIIYTYTENEQYKCSLHFFIVWNSMTLELKSSGNIMAFSLALYTKEYEFEENQNYIKAWFWRKLEPHTLTDLSV